MMINLNADLNVIKNCDPFEFEPLSVQRGPKQEHVLVLRSTQQVTFAFVERDKRSGHG